MHYNHTHNHQHLLIFQPPPIMIMIQSIRFSYNSLVDIKIDNVCRRFLNMFTTKNHYVREIPVNNQTRVSPTYNELQRSVVLISSSLRYFVKQCLRKKLSKVCNLISNESVCLHYIKITNAKLLTWRTITYQQAYFQVSNLYTSSCES